MQDGKALDKFGNKLSNEEVQEAHIPYDEFIYRGWDVNTRQQKRHFK